MPTSGGVDVTPSPVRRLAVLDFSGTLSIAATSFGRPETLTSQLRQSGLQDLGIDSPQMFWDSLITPTWHKGSTTRTGYGAVLAEAMSTLLRARARPVEMEQIRRCTAAFARRYFAASTIAPEWTSWLRRLLAQTGVAVVVATDHYAEATAHIADQMMRLGLRSASVAHGAVPDGGVLIANSADLGCHKSSRHFWEQVRHVIGDPAEPLERIQVVDDFGANEYADDRYAARVRVQQRRHMTVALLGSVFASEVDVCAFMLEINDESDGERAALARLVHDVGHRAVTWSCDAAWG